MVSGLGLFGVEYIGLGIFELKVLGVMGLGTM